MRYLRLIVFALLLPALLAPAAGIAAYDLEVPPTLRDEYLLQLKKYSQQLRKSYDRAFVDDYEGAIREVTKAIEILPDEGLGYAERAKYERMLNRAEEAELDFRKALSLFELAIRRYRPGKTTSKHSRKPKKGEPRPVDPAGAALLTATLRYQRGEAYFGFDQYRQAGDDFALACKGGSAIACSRLQEVKQMEMRGLNWAPLTSRLFYDRQRIDRPSSDVVRVWVRREDGQPARPRVAQEAFVQQLEFRCASREFRVIEVLDPSAPDGKSSREPDPDFSQPAPGGMAGKLMIMLCPRTDLK